MSAATCGAGSPAYRCAHAGYKPATMEERNVVVHISEPPHFAERSRRLDPHPTAHAAHGFGARGLASAYGALCQRFSGGRSDRYAVAHSVPKDERTVRAILRGREQSRRGRRIGGGCGGESATRRIHGRAWRDRPERACDRKLCKASL